MTQKRFIIFALVIILIASGTYFLIKIAKGYRFSLSQKTFQASGLLVATSVPDGAQIFIDGQLKSATNTTISYPPGSYAIEIKKEGFTSWMKNLKIEKELVTKADAWLFPLVPNLQSLTFTGVTNPLLSPDGSKIVYQVFENLEGKNGLWVLDLTDVLPFGSREPRQIIKSSSSRDFSNAIYQWSPDSRTLLVTDKKTVKGVSSEENFLLDTDTFTSTSQLADVAKNQPIVSIIKEQWEKEEQLKEKQKLTKLKEELGDIIRKNTKNALFSPDETQILYIATASASIPDILTSPLPSSSTQAQERNLKSGQTYIYDIKEDRNFLILKDKTCQIGQNIELSKLADNNFPSCVLQWFPSSRHLLFIEKNKIEIAEYEGTNWTTVYSGQFEFPFAYPNPAGNKLLILTNLSTLPDSLPNLYAVSLR